MGMPKKEDLGGFTRRKQKESELDVGHAVEFVLLILFVLLLCFGGCRCQIQIGPGAKDTKEELEKE